jgi:hypothetical protein
VPIGKGERISHPVMLVMLRHMGAHRKYKSDGLKHKKGECSCWMLVKEEADFLLPLVVRALPSFRLGQYSSFSQSERNQMPSGPVRLRPELQDTWCPNFQHY